MRLNSFLALFLSAVMAVPGPVLAQQAGASATAAAAPKPTAVKIVVLQGEGAQNNTRSRVGVNPVVEVRDESDKPVAGAEVVFQLPAAGPGGVFNGWMSTQTARTNEKGPDLRPGPATAEVGCAYCCGTTRAPSPRPSMKTFWPTRSSGLAGCVTETSTSR